MAAPGGERGLIVSTPILTEPLEVEVAVSVDAYATSFVTVDTTASFSPHSVLERDQHKYFIHLYVCIIIIDNNKLLDCLHMPCIHAHSDTIPIQVTITITIFVY